MSPSTVDMPTWVAIILVTGAVATALVGIAALLMRTTRGLDWVGQRFVLHAVDKQAVEVVDEVLADALGDRFERLLDERLAPIISELRPNSGTTIKDKIDRIDARLVADIEEGRAGRNALRADMDSHIDESNERHDGIEKSLDRIIKQTTS